MIVSLHGQRGVTLDLPASVTFETSNGQAFGSARLTIPRDSAAWDSGVVSERGGFLVTIPTGVGTWRGIANTPVYTPVGMTVECLHLNSWASIRTVSPHRRFCGLTGGAIAKRAVEDALIGSVPITIGSVVQAPPIVGVYEFKRQSLLSVLTDLSNQTGQQWTINANMEFTWRKQIGRFREFVLIDDGRWLDRLQRTPLADQIAEEIEIEKSGRTFTAHDHSVPALWPSQRITRL